MENRTPGSLYCAFCEHLWLCVCVCVVSLTLSFQCHLLCQHHNEQPPCLTANRTALPLFFPRCALTTMRMQTWHRTWQGLSLPTRTYPLPVFILPRPPSFSLLLPIHTPPDGRVKTSALRNLLPWRLLCGVCLCADFPPPAFPSLTRPFARCQLFPPRPRVAQGFTDFRRQFKAARSALATARQQALERHVAPMGWRVRYTPLSSLDLHSVCLWLEPAKQLAHPAHTTFKPRKQPPVLQRQPLSSTTIASASSHSMRSHFRGQHAPERSLSPERRH